MPQPSSGFEREYFEEHASYGSAGGYSHITTQARAFYSEYFRIAERVVPALREPNGRTALEVGCAFGVGSLLLHERGWRVTATDVSAYACERARELLPESVPVHVVDIRHAGDTLGTFDLVASIQVVEHVDDPSFLSALCSRVAPGGYILIATPNPASVSPYRRFQADPTHINENPPHYWARALEQQGLAIRHCGTYHILPFVHRWTGVHYVRVPQFIGYDSIIIAQRPA
jgi:2-polyprenyl-3-methyl-5-hydroxy-6-metoxy-1,4-benzoquinol methylase